MHHQIGRAAHFLPVAPAVITEPSRQSMAMHGPHLTAQQLEVYRTNLSK